MLQSNNLTKPKIPNLYNNSDECLIPRLIMIENIGQKALLAILDLTIGTRCAMDLDAKLKSYLD